MKPTSHLLSENMKRHPGKGAASLMTEASADSIDATTDTEEKDAREEIVAIVGVGAKAEYFW
jgi:hypothetical protein